MTREYQDGPKFPSRRFRVRVHPSRPSRLALLAVTILLLAGAVRGQDDPSLRTPQGNPPSRFMRIVKSEDGTSGSLDLAIVRYGRAGHPPSDPTVDLISVVHMADGNFYQKINEMLPSYDVVLYEFVAPDSTANPDAISREDESDGHRAYRAVEELMGFADQLDCIDYNQPNMLHADLTQDSLRRLLEEQGEKFPEFEALTSAVSAMQEAGVEMDARTRCKIRRLAAAKLMKTKSDSELFREIAILPRNAHALRILGAQLRAGKKKIAIIYGAAHMPDLQEHLSTDFHMQPLKRRWLRAWDLCAMGE
ncbi:MAG: hypothetical protein IH600_07615 [Bacteroidetes bacterium]|nr:hypothetical protein [Bacteroidota bacterium]